MNTINTKEKIQEEVIELAEKIKAAYAPSAGVCELAEKINAVIFESDDEAPAASHNEVKADHTKAALKQNALKWDLIEYFYSEFDERGILEAFDELLILIKIFAEENATNEYGVTPKAWTYAQYIAGLLVSIDEESDQARAISFLENPVNTFEEWKQ